MSTLQEAMSTVTNPGNIDTRVQIGETGEDRLTGALEAQTSKIPSSTFLGLAIGSMVVSLTLKMMRKDDWAFFVGQWAAPFLIMGNYNKMVKQHGNGAAA